MAKLKLDLEPEPDVTVIGISCHEKDYRLCWALNRSMGLALTRRRQDIEEVSAGGTAVFATYDHPVDQENMRLTLVHNHSSKGHLLKEQKQADFFLVMDNELVGMMPDLIDRLRRTEFVLAVFPLPFEQLRAGHKLLQEPT